MKSDPVDVLERCVGGRVKTHYIGFSQDFDDWRDPSTSGHLSVAADSKTSPMNPSRVLCFIWRILQALAGY